jgi:hypothetical protein
MLKRFSAGLAAFTKLAEASIESSSARTAPQRVFIPISEKCKKVLGDFTVDKSRQFASVHFADGFLAASRLRSLSLAA